MRAPGHRARALFFACGFEIKDSMDESPTGGRNERTSPLLLLTIILIAPLEGAPGAIRHTARVPCTLPPFLLRTFAIMALRSEGGGEDERQKRGT